MSARDRILGKLRRTLQAGGDDGVRRATVDERLADAPVGLVPQRGSLPPKARVDMFQRQAESVQATVERVASDADVPAAVARLLRERNLPARVRMGDDARLAAMPWASEAALETLSGRSHGDDAVTVSHALAGIAETGTLVLESGPDNPTTLNFLPELHLAVVRASDIEGDMEAVWRGVRARHGKAAMPRVVNMITGPSRSADIEQKLFLGAHGPRALHIYVIEDLD